jgi:hypothetical protein
MSSDQSCVRTCTIHVTCVSENAGSFMWFSHMWNHQQPHLYDNLTQLEMDMTLNREFAKVTNLSTEALHLPCYLRGEWLGKTVDLINTLQ